MKLLKQQIALTIFIFIGFINVSIAQDIYPPSKGKAVIYFIRTPSAGVLMNFRFFEKDNYLGKFNGVNYLRYECDPGKSLFWVKAENTDYIETDLKAGEIYLVEARGQMGAFSSRAKLFLVDYNDKIQMERIHKVFEKREGATFTDEELKKAKTKMESAIVSSIRKIQRKRTKKNKKAKFLTPEMGYKVKE